MTSLEIFAIEQRPQIEEVAIKQAAALKAKQVLCSELGLKTQAKSLAKDIAVLERGTRLTIPPLSQDEMTVWREWLPTSYSDGDTGSRYMTHYNFDRIPKPVLTKWKFYKDQKIFEAFEIWTPERALVDDPILLGVIGTNRYLLARWGESDANLLSFDDIRRRIWLRICSHSARWGMLGVIIPGFFLPLMVLQLMSESGASASFPSAVWPITAVVCVLGWTAVFLRLYIRDNGEGFRKIKPLLRPHEELPSE